MIRAPDGGDLREGGQWTDRQRIKNDLVHALVRVGLGAARLAPYALLRVGCGALGLLAYVVLGRERRRARRRLLALANGASRAIVLRAFLRAGDLLADTLALLDPSESPSRRLSLDPGSRQVFRAAFAEGRGVVFITAHLGPWERMAALLSAEGFPVATVARESYDPRLTRCYERLRSPRGVRSIYRGGLRAAFAMVRELAAGRALGFLVDLPGRVPCVQVAYLGEQRPFPVGPVRIALARRAAVVVGTASSVGERWVRIERVVTADLGRGLAGERELTERIVELLGPRLAASPTEWLGLFA